MKRDLRIFCKFLLMLSGCFFFLFLLGKAVVSIVEPVLEKEHTYITLQEAGNLVWLLADEGENTDSDAVLKLLERMEGDGETLLGFEQAASLMACLPSASDAVPAGYGKKESVKAEDFFAWFDAAREIYDPQGHICQREIYVLGGGQALDAVNTVLTQEGLYYIHTPLFLKQDLQLQKLTVIARDDQLYAIRTVSSRETTTLHNAWILQQNDKSLTFFWKDSEASVAEEAVKNGAERAECVADLEVGGGKLTVKTVKEEKISGRILRITDEGVELEGKGTFAFEEEAAFYRLYGTLTSLTKEDLPIGYDFVDFVLEEGRIAAGLAVKEENMEYIRVLIQNSGYGGRTHERIKLYADCDCLLYTGDGESEAAKRLRAGETLEISKSSDLLKETGRIRVVPQILTGRIWLPEVERSGGSCYRGAMEISLQEEGLVLINEVLLEEYLYAVVPSEMPASYSLEALKSQAVCARTYAYRKMCHAGLAQYGAHLDDSTAFQVYQNKEEQAQSTRAVKETAGMALFWQEEAAEVFYYSTSSGYGTDGDVWQEGNSETYPYLVSQPIADPVTGEAYEQEEPWYRWQYSVEKLDGDLLWQKLQERWRINPSGILTLTEEGVYVSEEPRKPGAIRGIRIEKDPDSGVVCALFIEGENACLKVLTEYNIRYVLCDGKAEAVRQDGTAVKMASILPSAFFDLETVQSGGQVTGYRLTGGGFGHGVGLSQNGAKNMAECGMGWEEILGFFYRGCNMRNIYVK